MRSSSCVQTDESSLEIVTLGAVHVVAEGEGVDGELPLMGGAAGAQRQTGCEAQPHQGEVTSSGGGAGEEHLAMVLC